MSKLYKRLELGVNSYYVRHIMVIDVLLGGRFTSKEMEVMGSLLKNGGVVNEEMLRLLELDLGIRSKNYVYKLLKDLEVKGVFDYEGGVRRLKGVFMGIGRDVTEYVIRLENSGKY